MHKTINSYHFFMHFSPFLIPMIFFTVGQQPQLVLKLYSLVSFEQISSPIELFIDQKTIEIASSKAC